MILHHGDCQEVLRTMPENSVDSIVTDPPYGLSFMGKKWDYDVPSEDIWRECLRVLKPGGHLLAFAGTRTQHRMAVRIEDAGFEIRDMIAWLYGSGFPKSLDVSKAIDKAAGAEREEGIPGPHYDKRGSGSGSPCFGDGIRDKSTALVTAPATDAAREWSGWGTALKPALEPITVARKPLAGTVAANVLAHGCGGINVDACRVGTREENESGWSKTGSNASENRSMSGANYDRDAKGEAGTGRWPANVIHDGSDEVLAGFPVNAPSGSGNKSPRQHSDNGVYGKGLGWSPNPSIGGDTGSAARFFYCAKASKFDRDEGCEGLELRKANKNGSGLGRDCSLESRKDENGDDLIRARNHHPTVKPVDLMRYLCRLVTPPGGTVLDPFMGSGSTGKAALLEGFQFIGIERDAEYLEIAKARIQHPNQSELFKP